MDFMYLLFLLKAKCTAAKYLQRGAAGKEAGVEQTWGNLQRLVLISLC